MPIPQLSHGLLPSGIHPCALSEIELAFVQNSSSDRRRILWEKFRSYVTWVEASHLFTHVYVDGSFTTDKPQPGDIDIVLQSPLSLEQFNSRLRSDTTILNYLNPAYTKPRFDVHPFLHLYGTAVGKNIIDLFQTLRLAQAQSLGLAPDSRKGILVFDL